MPAAESEPDLSPTPTRLVGLDERPHSATRPLHGDLPVALNRLGAFSPRDVMVATDFDGTLAPIVDDPFAAAALPANIGLLDRLVALGVAVAVVSGRSRHDLAHRIPIRGARIEADNGLDRPRGLEARALARFNAGVGAVIARWPGVWLECKPGGSSIHYRRAPDRGAAVQAAALPLAARFGLVAAMGKMVVEVRPQRADKANAVLALVAELQPSVVVYAGDDATDDGVFRALRELPRRHLGVGIGSPERAVSSFVDCDLVMEGAEGMAIFLRALVERVARSRPG